MLSIKVSRGYSGRITATSSNGHRAVTSYDGGKGGLAENCAIAAQACIDKHGLKLNLADARWTIVDGRTKRGFIIFAFEPVKPCWLESLKFAREEISRVNAAAG
tara:strand:+ start:133 stop:444 length:312 start_codon:yes stop_codon:yes gene_type:complete